MSEGVSIRYLPPQDLSEELSRLEQPWIADEGPLDVRFERGPVDRPLLPRGLAFDAKTTLVWDEDQVQVLTAAPPSPGVVALRSEVSVREGLRPPALGRLQRIDFLQDGGLVGSRYRPLTAVAEGGNDA